MAHFTKQQHKEIVSVVTDVVNKLRNLCHAAPCKHTGCPVVCSCHGKRKTPLNDHTAMIWELALSLRSIIADFDANPKIRYTFKHRTEMLTIRRIACYHSNDSFCKIFDNIYRIESSLYAPKRDAAAILLDFNLIMTCSNKILKRTRRIV